MTFAQIFAFSALLSIFGYLVITVWALASCLRNLALVKWKKSAWALAFFVSAPISSMIYPWVHGHEKSLKAFSALMILVSLLWIIFWPQASRTYHELAAERGIQTDDY